MCAFTDEKLKQNPRPLNPPRPLVTSGVNQQPKIEKTLSDKKPLLLTGSQIHVYQISATSCFSGLLAKIYISVPVLFQGSFGMGCTVKVGYWR